MERLEHDPFAGGELDAAAPLSPALRELWLASQLSSGANLAFNEVVELVLEGPVDPEAMARALGQVWRRHDALRARFDESGRYLTSSPDAVLDLRRHDAAGASASESKAELDALRRSLVEDPFDLEKGPLFRPVLWSEGKDRTRVFLAAHHTVLDGWSFGVILSELDELYRAEREGRVAELEAPPSFFRHLSTARGTQGTDVSWWLEQLGPNPPVVELPIDRERPRLRSHEARTWIQQMDDEVFVSLRQLGAKAGASVAATLQTAFALMIARLSGQTDFVLGLPLAGQPQIGLPGLVGHCVQTLPLRVAIDSEASFAENAKQMRALLLDAQEHGDATFQDILEKSKLSFDPSRIPLIPIAFNVDPAGAKRDFGVPKAWTQLVPRAYDSFELFLNIKVRRDGATLEWSYNRGLFEDATVEAWGALLDHLIRQILQAPDEPVGELDAVSPVDAPLLEALRPLPPTEGPATVVERLEAAMRLHSERTALLDDAGTLSFEDLDRASLRRARGLRARGVKRGDLVAVHAPRSADSVVSFIAILRAGAVYVPLDRKHPEARKRTILERAGPALILGERAGLPATELEVLPGSELEAEVDPKLVLDPPDPRDLAYVLFTSGSTGEPKGVAIEHQSLSRLVGSWIDIVGIEAKDRMLAATTFTFDISMYEIFCPLAAGASVQIASEDDTADPALLASKLEDPRVTLYDATPTGYRLLVEAGWSTDSRDRLRAVTVGEPLPKGLAEAMRARCKTVFNAYGPTESTVFCSYDVVDEGPVTIGRPAPFVELLVLDEGLRPVPVGTTGQLFIGGGLLARGYFSDPERTRERFIEHPSEGRRLYATGDLVRLRRDGRLSFQGRNDLQVKVRGLRIELQEIERALRGLDGVSEVAVVAVGDLADAKLRAYWSGAPDLQVSLRRHASERLPGYMVPSQWVHLPAFPLGPTGKVDRKALPEPEPAPVEAVAPPEGPRTPLEQEIGRLWARAIGVPEDQVGRDVDFFEAGGTSISAIDLARGLQGVLGRRVPVSVVLTHRSIAELAASLTDASRTPAPDAKIPAIPAPPRSAAGPESSPALPPVEGLVELKAGARRIFAIHDADGEIIPYRALAQYLPAELGLVGVLPESAPHVPCVHASVEAMAESCVERIRSAQPQGPYDLAGLCAGGVIAMAAARRLERGGARVSSLIALDAGVPWAPKRDAVFRARLARGRSSLAKLRRPSLLGVRDFARRVRNLVDFEAEARLVRFANRIRVQAFARNAARGKEQPDYLWEISTREIYDYAAPRYRMEGRLEAPVFVVAAGPTEDPGDLPMRSWFLDADLGWSIATRGPIQLLEGPSGHARMLQAPQVQLVADWLSKVL